MSEWTLRYWRKGTPLPPGWKVADDFEGCRHGAYAVLLVWVGEGES